MTKDAAEKRSYVESLDRRSVSWDMEDAIGLIEAAEGLARTLYIAKNL